MNKSFTDRFYHNFSTQGEITLSNLLQWEEIQSIVSDNYCKATDIQRIFSEVVEETGTYGIFYSCTTTPSPLHTKLTYFETVLTNYQKRTKKWDGKNLWPLIVK